MTTASSTITCYTDGGCRGNPGVGAWGFILIDDRSGQAMECADGEQDTTNNRMEMMAAIQALRSLKKEKSAICIHTDSKYLIDCCTQWMAGWKAKGWKKKGGLLKNVDLLQTLDELLSQHQVTWQWVKGHAGDPGNERADTLANESMDLIQADSNGRIERRCTWP